MPGTPATGGGTPAAAAAPATEPDAEVAGDGGAVDLGLNAAADGLNLNSLAAALSPFFDAVGGALLGGSFVAAAVGVVSPATLVPPTVAGVAAAAAAGSGAGTDLRFCAVAAFAPDAPAADKAGAPTVTSPGTLLMAATSEELADVATLSEQVAAPDGARATDDIVDVTTDGDLVLEPASPSASGPVAPPGTAEAGGGGGGSVSTPTEVTDATSEPARTVMEVMEPASDAASSTLLTSAWAGMSSFDTSDKWDGARADRPDRRSDDCR